MMKLLNLAVAVADLGMRIYRTADDKARREYRRVRAWNAFIAALRAGDDPAADEAFSRIRGEK